MHLPPPMLVYDSKDCPAIVCKSLLSTLVRFQFLKPWFFTDPAGHSTDPNKDSWCKSNPHIINTGYLMTYTYTDIIHIHWHIYIYKHAIVAIIIDNTIDISSGIIIKLLNTHPFEIVIPGSPRAQKVCYHKSEAPWGYPGYPHPNFSGIFPNKNHPAIGVPHFRNPYICWLIPPYQSSYPSRFQLRASPASRLRPVVTPGRFQGNAPSV